MEMIGRGLACYAFVLSVAGAGAADLTPRLSSPMVDRGIYRDGEVRRLTGRFGDWTVTCDEIVTLKQRFCSLRSVAASSGAWGPVYADVSTGDDGRPAALLHLPLGVSVVYGVDVEPGAAPSPSGGKGLKALAAPAHKLKIAACTPSECLAVWSPTVSEVQALTTGRDISLILCGPGRGPLAFATDLKTRSCETKSEDMLSAVGFRDAIRAATL